MTEDLKDALVCCMCCMHSLPIAKQDLLSKQKFAPGSVTPEASPHTDSYVMPAPPSAVQTGLRSPGDAVDRKSPRLAPVTRPAW